MPSRWRLAWLVQLIALPLMGLAWWANIRATSTPVMIAAQLVLLLAPVLGAAVAGSILRRKAGGYVYWPTRRPYARPIAYLLLAASLLFTLSTFVNTMLGDQGLEGTELIAGILLVFYTIATSGSALLIVMFFVIASAASLLISLIQVELGLFLGVWLTDRWLTRHSRAA